MSFLLCHIVNIQCLPLLIPDGASESGIKSYPDARMKLYDNPVQVGDAVIYKKEIIMVKQNRSN